MNVDVLFFSPVIDRQIAAADELTGPTGNAPLWGMDGAQFLQLYVLLAAVAVVAALLVRQRGGRRGPGGDVLLEPEALGYLAGGRERAGYVALAQLRAERMIRTVGRGRFVVVDQTRPAGSVLQAAVVDQSHTERSISAVLTSGPVRAAATELRDRLRAAGLKPAHPQLVAGRAAVGLLAVVEVLGVVRLATASPDDRTGYLVLVVLVVGAATFALLRWPPRRTATGHRALRDQRQAGRHLRNSVHPAWTTYGPVGLGTSVALFGTAALFALDPAFVEPSVPRLINFLGPTRSGSSSLGSPGGCGGGGCGSSSSSSCGSSSCGGGGCGSG